MNEAYADLANENLPLRDEAGQPLGRHRLDGFREGLAGLRETVRNLAANSQDLVLTTQLFIQTETLADDLFDLSQIAYENDHEEQGKRFSDLEMALDQDRELVQSFVLDLAAEKEQRIQELKTQNQDLQQKLAEFSQKSKEKSRRP
jgi:hypothetical protein